MCRKRPLLNWSVNDCAVVRPFHRTGVRAEGVGPATSVEQVAAVVEVRATHPPDGIGGNGEASSCMARGDKARKVEGRRWKCEGRRHLYSTKAARGDGHALCPDLDGAKPGRGTPGWKQKGASVSPSPRLYYILIFCF